ncbi:glycosyl hydrolase family 28-related protein [Paenibacillus filicis]|uniref:Glycosyl hydrolase family 28-related protein n=1 Tax=Paenibacillus gyeongsangnamensis TaxID=3388067 RepID=A0ABT4Q5E0_9BACL|nr:glycosyl hydrolase family 28-related protein [Paenibacillus filicis]MCZ8512038.1 glycosyl hydrolase family 28-related protein [Paenibacillus filicis]
MTDHIAFTVMTPEQMSKNPAQAVYLDDKGMLRYVPDYRGNTIPDFSNAGYMGGGVKLPEVQVKVTVEPGEGDDTARIQAAIDQVSKLNADQVGLRGAVLLKAGVYRIAGSIKISSSGVVLRGEGQGEDGTVLIATGTSKRALVQVAGSSGAKQQASDSPRTITDAYMPVGARSFHVQSVQGLKEGDTVLVRKISNKDFISFIKMDRITPRPDKPSETKMWEPFNLDFDRVITKIEGNEITVDAPLTDAIDTHWGGGTVIKSSDAGRIEKVGIENLRGDTKYNPNVKKTGKGKPYLADENHASHFITLNNVKNSWVKDITAVHFAIYAVSIGKGAKWNTVQDSRNLDMISVLTGGLRYPFNVEGELNLVQRVYSETARHAFVLGSQVKGPNVFLQDVSVQNHATSEPHHRWSVGGLFDNVSAPIAVQDRQHYGTGHGWAGANYVLWNTSGQVIAQKPPTASTWVIGHVGTRSKGAFEPRDPAFFASFGKHVEPRSLYLKQLEDRLGLKALEAMGSYTFHDVLDDSAQDIMSGDDGSDS